MAKNVSTLHFQSSTLTSNFSSILKVCLFFKESIQKLKNQILQPQRGFLLSSLLSKASETYAVFYAQSTRPGEHYLPLLPPLPNLTASPDMAPAPTIATLCYAALCFKYCRYQPSKSFLSLLPFILEATGRKLNDIIYRLIQANIKEISSIQTWHQESAGEHVRHSD